jgi:hypothetical protein
MGKRKSPLFVTLRFFDDDWNPIDALEMRNVEFDVGVEIMRQFRDAVEGDCHPLTLSEEIGIGVTYVTGEVTLGKV